MQAVGVIPSRYGASRFPGKPLAPIAGRPMIQRVWEGARTAKRLSRVVIATDDARIADACRAFGADVVMTRDDHPSGTDRIAEVARQLETDLVINVQGDEPLIEGFVIDAAVEALERAPDAPMATVVHALDPAFRDDPNRVKVVLDGQGRALYFSRNAIPHVRAGQPDPTLWQHVGLYAYRRDFLLAYADLPPTPAERAEGLEQLRALENGHAIQCAVVEGWESVAVDVPEDVPRVEARLAEAP
ncbi:MAG: 3-deoxy-manno-octulosonate cytidylyltransferase [Myxococcota bacterium]